MFKIAFVIFREFLEISLLLGIIVASMKSISNYLYLLFIGVCTGIIGSAILAYVMYHLSLTSSGYETEIIELVIVSTAVVLIGWTVVWMQGYGKKIRASFVSISDKVASNEAPKIIFVLLIATTIFREGAEMVLILYALSMSQKANLYEYLAGFIVGSSAGVFLGISIYLGLIKLATKHLFKVSSIIMSLICASLASEAAKILNNMGILTSLNKNLWDSSNLISDNSLIGNVMKIFFGYSAKPTITQIIFYFTTLFVIFYLTKNSANKRNLMAK